MRAGERRARSGRHRATAPATSLVAATTPAWAAAPSGSPVAPGVLADAVLVLHASFVAFVVVGLLLIFAGGLRGWSWVRHAWFRLAHMAAITVVVVQAWLGIVCPLTTLENALRARAGRTIYPGSFVAHWTGELLYHEAPPWVFALCYTAFGLLVLAAWLFVRPRPLLPRDRPPRLRSPRGPSN